MRIRFIGIAIFLLFVILNSYSQNLMPRFFKKADSFFKENISAGQVDYLNILSDRRSLDELMLLIAKADVVESSANVRLTFYINAYNILVIKNVIDHYPVDFPLEQIGFFSKDKHLIAGDSLTLNQIEFLKLNKEHKDLRILFVLSSATKGSIPLADFAYQPKNIDKQLESRIKLIVNDYDIIRVFNKSSPRLLLAESFKRAQVDFDKKEMIALVNKYRTEPLTMDYIIEYFPSNRKLNIK